MWTVNVGHSLSLRFLRKPDLNGFQQVAQATLSRRNIQEATESLSAWGFPRLSHILALVRSSLLVAEPTHGNAALPACGRTKAPCTPSTQYSRLDVR